ncbi:Amidophosphoribosyltransferase [Trichinella pseudospiralis]
MIYNLICLASEARFSIVSFDFEQTEDRLHGYTIFGFQFPKGSVMIVLIVQIRKADRARDEPLTKVIVLFWRQDVNSTVDVSSSETVVFHKNS